MTAESITSMDAALYMAAVEGQIEKFRDHQGSLHSLCTTNRDTVLHVHVAASTHGVEGFMKEVLENCPSLLHQSNAQGQTPLHIAAKKRDDGMVKFLINQARAQSKEHPESDFKDGGKEAARKTLRKKDEEMNTALHLAAEFGHLPVVEALLELEDPDFCYSDNNSHETPLYIAAASGKRSVVAAILDKFQLEDTCGGPHGRTALHIAAENGDAEITRIIAEKRVGNYMAVETDENGHTPLHYAAHLGHLYAVRELLKCDNNCAAAYIGDKEWEMTPLLVAARQGEVEIAREILQRCPNCLEKVDKRGWNVAHFLVARKVGIDLVTKNPLVRNLIDEEDIHGITPRQMASLFFPKVAWQKDLLMDIFTEDEVAGTRVRSRTPFVFLLNKIDKAVDSLLVVATLVATVAFTAGITVPGGYKSDHEQAGTPFLLHSAAFQAFVISDALAFAFSLYAIFTFFGMRRFSYHTRIQEYKDASTLLGCALVALPISFSTALYVVLKPAPVLASVSCFIGLCFFSLSSSWIFIFISKHIIFSLFFYLRTRDY